MAKVKNQNQVTQNKVKYEDPRMGYLSTKNELVLKETTIRLNCIYPDAMNDVAVICEDQNGLYVTGKSYVNSLALDPYRNYKRNLAKVTKNETEYNIQCGINNFSVTI